MYINYYRHLARSGWSITVCLTVRPNTKFGHPFWLPNLVALICYITSRTKVTYFYLLSHVVVINRNNDNHKVKYIFFEVYVTFTGVECIVMEQVNPFKITGEALWVLHSILLYIIMFSLWVICRHICSAYRRLKPITTNQLRYVFKKTVSSAFTEKQISWKLTTTNDNTRLSKEYESCYQEYFTMELWFTNGCTF